MKIDTRLGRHAIPAMTVLSLLMTIPARAQPNPSFVSAPRGPLTLEGAAGLGSGQPEWTYGGVAHRIPFRIHNGIGRLELAGLVGNDMQSDGDYARLQGRILLDFQNRGLWLGGAGRRAYERGEDSSPLFGLGAWARLRDMVCSAAVEQTADVVVRTDYVYSYADSGYIGIEAREKIRRASFHAGLGWSRGRVALETVAGISVSHAAGPRQWIRGSAALAVVPGLALVATGGSQTPGLFDIPESNHGQATVGLRLTPGRSPSRVASKEDDSGAWQVIHEGEGWYAIEVRIVGAQAVEITSDATEWAPRALEQIAKDRWRLRLRLDPGVYHLNLRVDGGPWTVPPGAPAVSDDFNGQTGVLVVEK